MAFNSKLRFDLLKSDVGHRSIIFNGFYELELTRKMIKLGAEGGLLIDVGANYGYFSCLWASQNAGNSVVAFEASPDNIEPLRNNVNKNGLSQRVNIVPTALGKEQGKLKFSLGNESQQTGWGGFTLDTQQGFTYVEVNTLDDYATQHHIDEISALKIDTEGADTWVLYGAERLLRGKKIRHIFFENNWDRMKMLNIGRNEAIEFLGKLDYIVEEIDTSDFYAYPRL